MDFLNCDDYLLQSCFYPNPELCQLLTEKMEEIQRLALGSFADIAYEQKMKSFADEAPAQMMKQHKSPFDSRANVPVARSGKAQLRLRLGDSDDSSTGSSTVGYCEPLPSLAPILYPTQNSKPFNHPGCFMYYHTIASTTSSETIIARETLSPQDGRVVCMKVFRKKYLLERNLVAYPIRELLAYKQLAYAPKHDGDAFVMKLEGCMQDKNRLFFAMQLMQCDLSNILRGEAPHRPIQAQRWIAQISMGIAAIHAAGLIHRDIKPANILLDTQDNVKIADFGSSYVDANGRPVNPKTSYSHHVAGTRGYMAPEMIYCQGSPQKYGLQVDYWSLGCVAFQLEMGSPKSPFPTCKDLDRYLAWDSDLLAGRSYFSYAGAFDLIVKMGNKMNSGGLVKRGMMEGMDEDTATEAKASVDEFVTMMAGGLAGATPHTISATITAISRLVFEFKDAISPNIHTEILSTILVFLTSANREIVKSALGYVKLAIHTLPVDLVRPHLKDLVHQLLAWSHDHKNHFKVKVRHIFERMIRRFGWDAVYACAEGEDSSKVLLNIKKRKDRAKRKRVNKDQEEDEPPTSAKPATGTAFEDVLYGSESELSDSDEEDAGPRQSGKTKAKTSRGAQLRVDDDEPMDLLSGAASRITSTQNKRRRQPGHEASLFNTDDAGKLVIESSDDEAADDRQEEDVVGTAYHESLTSVDGFTRGPRGQVKFNKDTKKRRREADERDQDVEMADPEAAQARPPKNKKKTDARLGQEFKAKKAGGDVKKGGVDPYAYLSLSQAAKKGQRGRTSIGIAGKRTK